MAILVDRLQTVQALLALTKSLPPNEAANFTLEQLQQIFRDMYSDYVWPQVTARLALEPKWDRLQRMYEVKKNKERPRQKQKPENQTVNTAGEAPPELSETIIFDTVDRLKNLNFFIAWKDRPVQYNKPRFLGTSLEDNFYNPTTRKVQSANAILDWNNEMQGVRTKHLPLAQHHYLYGLSFVHSDFIFEIDGDKSSDSFLLIKNIGTTFTPISIRKLWLNPTIPINEMDKQVCPFFFDLQVRGTVMQNVYDPQFNPFGFVNLDKLNSPTWLFGQEAKSFTEGLPQESRNILTQMRPEFTGEALWTFFPYLTLPPTSSDPNPVMRRYIVQVYSNNLLAGGCIPLRIQRIYHPQKRLPIYGSAHIPDLDSGLYTPSIAEILEDHFDELVRAKTQFTINKDLVNNPPTEVLAGTPAANNQNINRPGAINEVSGPTDIQRRVIYDATQTSIAYMQYIRDAAQTSGKAVDAILGKAMGGRTTATEASNAFQASMSGVTSDVDQFCSSIYGEYAIRVWENLGKFMPKLILDRICGTNDMPPLMDQDLLIHIGLKTDVGSTFIESIVKQQHLQEAIAASTQSPFLDQAILWKALFRELKLPEALDAVKDNGFEMQVSMAYDQAVQTYLGQAVAIDPNQDHQIAMRVKTRFLQDTKSAYNQEYAANPSPIKGLTVTQYLAEQIKIHQQFVMLAMQQQMMIQAATMHDEQQQQVNDRQHQLQLKQTNGRPQTGGPAPTTPSPSQGTPTGQ